MSIDTTFKPLYPTSLVDVAAIQVVPAGDAASGVVSFRIHNVNAAAVTFGWGTKAANTSATPAAVGAPQNAITLGIGDRVYLELPYNTFFISSTAASVEVTPGMGGVGG